MNIRSIFCFVFFLGLIVAISCSGCVGSKTSAAEEINTSTSLVNSAELKLKGALSDRDIGSYAEAKTKLKASRVEFEEALKILNNATSDYEEENQMIETFKVFAAVGIDRVNASENLISTYEHIDKFEAYSDLGFENMNSEDFNKVRFELDKAIEGLNNSITNTSSARVKLSSLNIDSVPVGQKSNYTIIESDLEYTEKLSSDTKEMVNGLSLSVDGLEALYNSIEYAESEEWDKAANECANSSVKFSESVKIFQKLQDSEFTEVSDIAIEYYGNFEYENIEELLTHYEAACRYMSEGKESQALEEFDKVSSIS